MYQYPQNLVQQIKSSWRSLADEKNYPDLPADDLLLNLLDVAYHASMEQEEARPLRFRLVFCSKKRLNRPQFAGGEESHSAAQFAAPRQFNVEELRRLAPVTDPSHVLIGVQPTSSVTESPLEIWGVVTCSRLRGLVDDIVRPDPAPWHLVVGSDRSGNVEVSCGSETIIRLGKGRLIPSAGSVFDDGPILGFFSPAIEEARTLLAEVDKVANLAAEGIWAEGVQDHFAGVFASMIRRMKQFGHGGTVVALPDDYTADDPRIRDLIDIKYVLQDLELRHAFHSFLKSQWNAARHGHPKVEGDEKIEPDKVRVMLRHLQTYNECLEHLERIIDLVAGLTKVDGAVVMTRNLRILGFGAEITAHSSLSEVAIAVDATGMFASRQKVAAFGTRHRSAIRLCANLESAVVFVLSQDGGPKAIKRIGRDVVLWPDVRLEGSARSRPRRKPN